MSTIKLPELDQFHDVTYAQAAAFRQHGHVLIPNVLNVEEVLIYRDVIKDAADKFNTEKRDLEERDTYGKAFLQIMNLWEVDEQAKKFTLAKRMGKIAADLL